MDRNLAQMLLCICIVLLIRFFIFSSGIVNKILSQICGRLYFPIFLLRVVHPNIHVFFDGSGQAVFFFSSNNFKVLHRCFMPTVTWMYKYWGWGLQMFLESFTKCSTWLSYVFFIAGNFPTTVAVNDTVLVSHYVLILWWHQDVLQCLTSLEVYNYSMFPTNVS